MRLPLLWLHDYCDPGLEPFELATRLAMTGTEVDRVHTHGVTDLRIFFENDLRFLEQFG